VNEPLDDLAARLAGNPFFLAHPLVLYRRRHGLTDLALAAELHCDPSALKGLRLCRRPVPGGERFEGDIGVIARWCGCDAAALRRVLEEVR
jgi:hypothetical protein